MYFGYWDEKKYKDIGDTQIAFRNAFISAIEQHIGMTFSDKQRSNFPKIAISQWLPHAAAIQKALIEILAKHIGK